MTTAELFRPTIEQLGGVSVRDLVKRYGTPLYVYDAAVIRQRIDDLRAFDVIRYAQKASSNLGLLDLVRRAGVLVDAVSAGEIRRALAAGYAAEGEPPPIVYTADIFDREALELCVAHGLAVNCGSPNMIDQYGERVPGGEVTLRINPGFGHGHSQKTNTGGEQSKHGIWHEQLDDCVARAAAFDVTISGIHMHIGSGSDLGHLSQVAGALEKAAKHIGPTVRTISAGGGLPVAYTSDDVKVDIEAYFKRWDATRRTLEADFGHPISLEIEPGRYLVAESGSLIAEIRAIKSMGSNLYYLVDAGFNDLARPILYGAYHPMAVCHVQTPPTSPAVDVVVGGPLCESGDIFTQEEGGFVCHRRLPAANVGDLLVIGCAGAYGSVMGSNYNSKPLAAEILLENGKPHLIRTRQTFDEMVQGESIPPGPE